MFKVMIMGLDATCCWGLGGYDADLVGTEWNVEGSDEGYLSLTPACDLAKEFCLGADGEVLFPKLNVYNPLVHIVRCDHV